MCCDNLKITLGSPQPLPSSTLIHSLPEIQLHSMQAFIINPLVPYETCCRTMPQRRRDAKAINKAIIWKEKQNCKASNCSRGSNLLCSASNSLAFVCGNHCSFSFEILPTLANHSSSPTTPPPSHKNGSQDPLLFQSLLACWTQYYLHSSKEIIHIYDRTLF